MQVVDIVIVMEIMVKKNCDFSTLGLYDELSKKMVDDTLWYLGA